MIVRLQVVEGPERGRSFSFDCADSFLVGRSPKAHLVLDPRADRYISRTHCLIDIRPPRCLINDLGSTNGTYLNEERIGRAEIRDGDEVRVGRTRIEVAISGLDRPEEFATRRTIEVPDVESAVWQPPEQAGTWEPPSFGPAADLAPAMPVGQDPGGAAAVTLEPRAAPELVCWLCSADLSGCGDADGLASSVVDAVYLCCDCEASLSVRTAGHSRIGAYTLLGELGRGGMGVVYRGVHTQTRRVCAIKQILPDVVPDERTFRLFEREIGIQSRVRHTNLARLLDHGQDHGTCYFVVEFLAGGDARKLVTSIFKGPVDIRLAIRIILQVLDGLEALHAHGFVHRDLKPGNILLSRPPNEGFGRAKITDYGLAKSFEEAGNSLFELTQEGEAAGSLMFMPPEQVLNYRFVRPPADVYAAGVTLYYLLTGRYTVDFPELGGADGATALAGHTRNPIEALIEDAPVPIRERRSDLSEHLARVVDTAVQKELSRRYASAAEFRVQLLAAARLEELL